MANFGALGSKYIVVIFYEVYCSNFLTYRSRSCVTHLVGPGTAGVSIVPVAVEKINK